MRAGLNLLLHGTHVSNEMMPVVEGIAAAGWDGVEVPILEGDDAFYRRLGARRGDLGPARTVVVIVQSPEADPVAEDADARAAAVDYLESLVDRTAALGAEVLCGPLTQPLGVSSGRPRGAADLDRLVAAHRALAGHAGGSGVAIAVERLNRPKCYALNTAHDAAALADAVGAVDMGYLYDTIHDNIGEADPALAIRETAARIAHVHVSENHRGTPGRGHADFAAALAALRGAGYDGRLVVEAFGHALPEIAAAAEVWRPLSAGGPEKVRDEGLRLFREGWAAAA